MGYIKSVSPLKQFHPKFTDMRLFIHAKIEVNPCLIKKKSNTYQVTENQNLMG